MKKRWFLKIIFVLSILLATGFILILIRKEKEGEFMKTPTKTIETISYPDAQVTPQNIDATSSDSLVLPSKVLLNDNYYVPQTFNNCGPAALSMDLSYYGVDVSQETLADILRPDHNTTGHDDEKSTPPEDIAAQAEQYDGLIAYYRPAGTIELLKELLASGFPVLVRTLYKPTDEVAHYRVIKGYDDTATVGTSTPGEIIDEDGFQGPNVTYSYADFMSLWKYFNYEYIVLTPPDKQPALVAILGDDATTQTAWQDAENSAANDIQESATDTLATFNLSVADYYLGDYASSTQAFESVQTLIPPDTLWYQIEPIESYYELGQYDKVFSLSQIIFNQGNPAVPKLYVLRGESDLKENNIPAAKSEFETALIYNKNLQSAQSDLAALVATSTAPQQ